MHLALLSLADLGNIGLFLAAVLALGFFSAPLWVWTLATAVALCLVDAAWWTWLAFLVPAWLFNVTALRKTYVTKTVMRTLKRLQFLPEISETERAAIEAGETWVDRELFSGRPDLKKLATSPYPGLSAEEQAFVDGPTEQLCRMVDDWDLHQRREVSPEVWDFIKRERFLGMIVPKEYGGLGFTPSAHSAVIQKLASRSMPLAVTVMVPNSLGPAELLIHYGTPAQRTHWLPRLARGQEMPCFALTEPEAGSDAGAMRASGEVFKGEDDKLYLRLNWDKRYITLAGISTVLGLAFKLRDPGNLLGKGVSPGITCALIPTATAGVDVSRRHDPLGSPFFNCPTTGRDVVVSADAIIGGVEGAGRGWQMLMECLAAGRGISLPALATGCTKLAARVASAHATTRRQFGMAIGKFEGIEEPLARITGTAYMLEAARRYTCGGLDAGVKPPVVTAMCKYQFTELARAAINDAMDVLGGAAISKGPRNLLANTYTAIPICITVEGANILTRTLMVFGQGAIRCHPFAFHEIDALGRDDLNLFDRAFWGHVGHVVRNACRATVLTLSRGWLANSPVRGPAAPYYRKLAWASASFALWADVAMASLGGDLKRREKVTGRFADIFSWMYLATATLRRFVEEGQREEDYALLRWSMCQAFDRMQVAFDGLFSNLPIPFVPTLVRGPVAWWSRVNRFSEPPTDTRTSEVAHIAQRPGPQRDAITAGIFLPASAHEPLTQLDEAFVLAFRADDLARKIKAAMRNGRLPRGKPEAMIDAALVEGILTPEEADVIMRADKARREVCQVDSFTKEEYFATARRETRQQKPQVVS